MSQLDTPVPILQHELEFARLLELYRQRNPRRVLEVGTYHGGTLYHWLRNARPGAVVVTVDHHVHSDNRHLFDGWAPTDVTLHVISGDSTDPDTVARAAGHAPYDWVFIDADHQLVNVRSDWQHYGSLAAPGALIVLHDILPSDDPSIHVDELWAELERDHDTTTIAEPGGFGIGLVHARP